MTVFAMPEGVEAGLKIFLVGMIEDVETEIVLTVGGFRSFSDSVVSQVNVEALTKTYELDKLGTGWRVMTRDEIADYKKRESD